MAVVDVDRDAADRLAQRYAVGAAVAESLESLPSTAIDVVHVCTPISSHASLIHAAIARRLPVIVEKPLAADAPSTEQLLRDAARAGVWVVPVHQTLFQAGVERAVRWAHGQTLSAFDYRACSAGATTPALQDIVAAEILPHPLSLLETFFAPGGTSDELLTIDWDVRRPRPGELAVTGVAGTMVVRLLISMHARPVRHDLTLLGEAGTMSVDLFHGFASLESRRAPTRAWKLAQPFAAAASLTASASANLARRIVTHEPAYPGLNALVARAYQAIGRPERRPLTDRHTLMVARCRDQILRCAARD